MMNDLKKILLAGLGSAAYTYEKASNLVEEFVEKGKLTMEEGKELSEELKRDLKHKEDKYKPISKQDMTALINELNLATKEDIEAINARISILEERLNNLNV